MSKYSHLNECPKCGKKREEFASFKRFAGHTSAHTHPENAARARAAFLARNTIVTKKPAPAPVPVVGETAGARPSWEAILTAVPDADTLADILVTGILGQIRALHTEATTLRSSLAARAESEAQWAGKAKTAQRELSVALEANARLTEETAKLRDEINTKRVKLKRFDLDQFRQTVTSKVLP